MSVLYTSVCRIADLSDAVTRPLPRAAWGDGDYVVGEVVSPPHPGRFVELVQGRHAEFDVGDQIVGAFGRRAATLEATGSWDEIGEEGRFHLLTPAGLFGRMRSVSPFVHRPSALAYAGHLVRDGHPLSMSDFAVSAVPVPYHLPTVLVVGSSMSAGKTASARKIIRRLSHMGCTVVAAKLTGAGRQRDILSMQDAGAAAIFDFVDAGLPSTVVPEAVYRPRIAALLTRIAAAGADVAVIEAGASPLEPYNGEACLAMLRDHVRMTVLCASDPYAVVGITQAFERRPDVVAGICTNTDAGIALIRKLTGLEALRLVGRRSTPRLDEMLLERFGSPADVD